MFPSHDLEVSKMNEDNFIYKWKKIFASKRFHTKDGVIELTPIEQQELLDDHEQKQKLNQLDKRDE